MKIPYSFELNRGRFETLVEKPSAELIQVTQIHGTDIASPETLPCEADGMVASWDDITKPMAIKTADCLPVLIEGLKGVVFIHAGWRGLAQGILEKPDLDLIDPQTIVIGPSIQECCFEVSSDFSDNFPGSPYFKTTNGRHTFNLQEEAIFRLKQKFPDVKIENSGVCTCCNLSFHSYRRDKTTQRNWNLYIKG